MYLVTQPGHGTNSPVWLFTDSEPVAKKVLELVPAVAGDMPNAEVVQDACRDYGEIIPCEIREEVVL